MSTIIGLSYSFTSISGSLLGISHDVSSTEKARGILISELVWLAIELLGTKQIICTLIKYHLRFLN